MKLTTWQTREVIARGKFDKSSAMKKSELMYIICLVLEIESIQ